MTATRIYRVADGDAIRLVEASSAGQAIRHCAAQRYGVTIAKPKDVAYLVSERGVKVEQAKPDATTVSE